MEDVVFKIMLHNVTVRALITAIIVNTVSYNKPERNFL